MKKIGNALILYGCFSLLLLLIYGELREIGRKKEQYQSVSVRLEEEGVTQAEIENALEEEKKGGNESLPDITLWNQGKKVEVQYKEYARRKKVYLIQICGDMVDVLPGDLAYGNYVHRENKMGCVIDKKTAFDLWGTENAVGNPLTWKDKEWIVTGIIDSKQPIIGIQESSKELLYQNMEFLYQEKEMDEDAVRDFLMGYLYRESYVLMDNYMVCHLTFMIKGIPFCILASCAAIFIMTSLYRMKGKIIKNKLQTILYIVGMIAVSFLLAYLLFSVYKRIIYIPDKYVPGKWSDFHALWEGVSAIYQQISDMNLLSTTFKDRKILDLCVPILSKCLWQTAGVILCLKGISHNIVKSDTFDCY